MSFKTLEHLVVVYFVILRVRDFPNCDLWLAKRRLAGSQILAIVGVRNTLKRSICARLKMLDLFVFFWRVYREEAACCVAYISIIWVDANRVLVLRRKAYYFLKLHLWNFLCLFEWLRFKVPTTAFVD